MSRLASSPALIARLTDGGPPTVDMGDSVVGMPTHLQHLDDVPEQDRELVSPLEITEGDEVFCPPDDQWVTIDQVVAGLDPSQSSWRVEQDESGKWTFVHSFTDAGTGPVVSGMVERCRR